MRAGLAVGAIALLLASVDLEAGPPAPHVGETQVVAARVPTAFTFAPDGAIFYGTREGQVRRADLSTGSDQALCMLPGVVTDGEQGLLGIALHPGFPHPPWIYAYATTALADGTFENRIVRFREDVECDDGTLQVLRVFPNRTPFHNSGVIHFGPDGMLYAVVGNAEIAEAPQDLGDEHGKVLRLRPDGDIPADNPFPGSAVWSYGLRNSFGFAWDPATGYLWESENGPECNDEVNRIVAGGNYASGPSTECPPREEDAVPQDTNRDGPEPRLLPEHVYPGPVALTGVTFCPRSGCGIPGQEGNLLMADCLTGSLHGLTLSADRRRIEGDRIVYSAGREGCLLALERAPDGSIYVSNGGGITRVGVIECSGTPVALKPPPPGCR